MMNKEAIIAGLEDELEELKKQQRDFVHDLNEFYCACLDEHHPPMDLLDLSESGVLDISILDLFPSEIVRFLQWHSRSMVIASIESTIEYLKQPEIITDSAGIIQIAQKSEDLQEKKNKV